MRKAFAILIIITTLFSCQKAEKGFEITATLEGLSDNATIYLYDRGNREYIDTAYATNSVVKFTGEVENISNYYLIYKYDNGASDYVQIWVDNVPITVTGSLESLSDAAVVGTDVQKQSLDLKAVLEPYENRIDSIYSVYNEDDEEAAQFLSDLYDTIMLAEANAKKQFVKDHPEYFYSVIILERLIREMTPEEGKEMYAAIPEENKANSFGEGIEKYLLLNKNLQVGDTYVDLALKNVDGNEVKLSEVATGKYVLIDFWASWCNPCRQENPNLKKAIDNFGDKGFTVYAVSLDTKEDSWKKAIEEDEISWTTVIDTKAFDSDAALMYSVRYIPHNFLLSPEGEILAIDLRGKALEEKLEELLKS
ncbi:MAG: AhpC/TSA family protein [Bacteroidales bacterium]|nr:AhpC/TSA family protein [Bacteroidales bacterium]MBN2821204.1 AhpC/TSA family protein [Bacteroidales bacterium]